MNITFASNSAFNLHVVLEQSETGKTIASIAEFADCQVEAETREAALVAIQQVARERLGSAEILSLEVSPKGFTHENPWEEFIGMFAGDVEFAEMASQWQAEQELNAEDDAA